MLACHKGQVSAQPRRNPADWRRGVLLDGKKRQRQKAAASFPELKNCLKTLTAVIQEARQAGKSSRAIVRKALRGLPDDQRVTIWAALKKRNLIS